MNSQTPEQRIESARHAAEARWAKQRTVAKPISEGTNTLEISKATPERLLRKGNKKEK